LAAAQDGETITLLSDVEVTEMFNVTKSMTIDLNGHKLSRNDGNSVVQVTENAKLTID
jgi:hypothetical protein